MIQDFYVGGTAGLTAGQSVSIPVNQANFIRIVEGNYPFEIRLERQDNGRTLLDVKAAAAGLAYGPFFEYRGEGQASGFSPVIPGVPQSPFPHVEPAFFNTVRIVNGSTAQNIRIVVGDAPVADHRLIGLVSITGGIDSNIIPANTMNTGSLTVTSSGVLVLAANTDRKSVTIQNVGTVNIGIGNGSATAFSEGLLLIASASGPGGSIDLETTAAIYAGVSSTSGSLRYMEHEKV